MKPVMVWIQLAACSGCSLSFMDDYSGFSDMMDNYEISYHVMLKDEVCLPKKIDLAIIEGACALTRDHIETVNLLRDRSTTLVSIGACAATGNILNYAVGNQMPMPELDAFLPIHEVVKINYAIPGCPPAPEAITKFLQAYLSKDLNYLMPYYTTIGKNEDKIRSIVKNGLCVSCGMCGATCPTNAISFVEGKPVIRDELCILCGECYFQCPRSFFLSESDKGKAIGSYDKIMSLRSTIKKIRNRAQSGGTVTSLFAYALDNDIVDGVIVAENNDENIWQGDPIIVTDSEKLLSTAGTKYSVCPILHPLKDAITNYGLNRLGIVGVPCQHEALHKMERYPLGIRHVASKIALKIGLFCTSNFRFNAMTKMVEELGGIRPEDIRKIEISSGSFNIHSTLGDTIKLPLNVVHDYEQESCKICHDFTSEFSDVSVGSLGSPSDWSTVITRNKFANELVAGAISEGYLVERKITTKERDIVNKISSQKKKKADTFTSERDNYGLLVPFYTL